MSNATHKEITTLGEMLPEIKVSMKMFDLLHKSGLSCDAGMDAVVMLVLNMMLCLNYTKDEVYEGADRLAATIKVNYAINMETRQ